MTDRLSALLHEEADRLEIPVPRAREALRPAGASVAAAGSPGATAVVAVVAVWRRGPALPAAAPRRRARRSPTGRPGPDGSTSARCSPRATRSTSTAVRYSRAAGGGADDLLHLRRPARPHQQGRRVRRRCAVPLRAGHVRRRHPTVGLPPGEIRPASTDPAQPYVAYARPRTADVRRRRGRDHRGGGGRVDVPALSPGVAGTPPVAVSGDLVSSATTKRPWPSTGARDPRDHPGSPSRDARRGWRPHLLVRTASRHRSTSSMRATGATVLGMDAQVPYGILSPDGRYAKALARGPRRASRSTRRLAAPSPEAVRLVGLRLDRGRRPVLVRLGRASRVCTPTHRRCDAAHCRRAVPRRDRPARDAD